MPTSCLRPHGKGRAAIDALLGMVPEYVPEALVSSHGRI